MARRSRSGGRRPGQPWDGHLSPTGGPQDARDASQRAAHAAQTPPQDPNRPKSLVSPAKACIFNMSDGLALAARPTAFAALTTTPEAPSIFPRRPTRRLR
eukprot:4173877-Pyramimonas_sp.AAC.1